MAENRNEIVEAVVAFVKAQSWDERKRILEERRGVLLTDAADEILGYLLTQYQDDGNTTAVLEEHRELLARCRREGIDAAFADLLQPPAATPGNELRALIQELSSQSAPGEMPRRIAICREALSLVDRGEQPELWARLQGTLGNSLRQNPQGDRADNIERAISHYEQALEIYTREALPVQWAMNQHNLANAYSDRIRGKKAENLEKAISRYELALEVRTRQNCPEDWARTQNNLAIAYWNRIRGERSNIISDEGERINKTSNNIEETISHYEQALKVYTQENFPVEWARIQRSLATVYLNGGLGGKGVDESDNIDEAIEGGRRTLEYWIAEENNRSDNIKEVISRYELALEVFTREDFPVEWARTQDSLGSAYRPSVRGFYIKEEQDEKILKEAISHYEQALEVFTREDFPVEWADAQNNLAEAYEEYIIAARDAFLNAQTQEMSKRIVEENRDVLLTDAVEESLTTNLSTDWDGSGAPHHTLEEKLTLLGRCRREGIDAAFAGLLDSPAAIPENELEALIQELDRPSLLGEMPQRIAACQEALALIDRNDQPELWAWLHVKLGDGLRKNLQGKMKQDIEEAISHYEQALEVYTREDFPVEWARTQKNLFRAYTNRMNRIRGKKAENWKSAIFHYEQALEVYTREDFPVEWAQIQDRLVFECEHRLIINGRTWDRLRKAMVGFGDITRMAVLTFVNAQTWDISKRTVRERQDMLLTDAADKFLADLLRQYEDEYATHHILEEQRALLRRCRREGIDAAFADRLRNPLAPSGNGLKDLMNEIKYWIAEKKEWIEFAAYLLKEIWTYGSTPVGRMDRAESEALAESQAGAGSHVALSERLQEDQQGDRAQNIEEAISHLEQALEVYAGQGFRAESKWAATHQKLAKAYKNRIRGDRSENLEEAISHYELVFERTFQARTRGSSPVYWAATHHNLADAYEGRIRGDREHNIEEAIRHYERALEVRTREDFPVEWARTQNSLANAYSERIRGDKSENLEEAISRYKQALGVRTEYLPVRWAETQHNLANAYKERIRGEKADNIEEAIYRCEQALEIRTREDYPVDWAATHHNLAGAYEGWIRGDREHNIEEAIHHYELALEVCTPDTLPQDCRDAANALGYLLYGEGRYPEARAALTTAHEAVEALRGELQREEAKQRLAEENADLYARLVHCCLAESDEESAFNYAVAGKGRAFVDMLASARFDLSAAGADDPQLGEDLRRARELRQQIDNLLARLYGEGRASPDGDGEERGSAAGQSWAELRPLQEREAAHWEDMSYRYPSLMATRQAPTLSVGEAQKLSEEIGATLVEYYRHAGGWCAFVVSPEEISYIPLPGVDEIREEMLGWLREVESQTGRNEWSYDSLRNLHQAVIAPLGDHLPRGGAVALAPFSWLHLVPLNAALDPATGRYATDDYLLELTPNLGALRVALDQKSGQDASSGEEAYEKLLGVAYPGAAGADHYLHNVLSEAEAVARHFPEYGVTPLHEDDATPEAVLAHARGHDVIHFGCHGDFDPEAPEQSGLVLSGGWLTVQRVITELHLEETRLATIGACLSGRVRLRRGEEHVGLVQAMMSAGAGAVVASLWPVDDTSTRVLFNAFYAGIKAGKSPAVALEEAARTVRSYPGWEHPYYWAAFQPIGLAHREDGSGASAR